MKEYVVDILPTNIKDGNSLRCIIAAYHCKRSSSDGVSSCSIVPAIISDLITSTRLRKAVSNDKPGCDKIVSR